MRSLLQDVADEFIAAKTPRDYKRLSKRMDKWLTHGANGKLIAIETHDSNIPAYLKLSQRLVQWKQKAAERKIPTFYFTLLRQPNSLQVSAFNYYYLKEKRNGKSTANDTVPEFLATLLHHPVCHFLAKGGGFFAMIDNVRRDDVLQSMNENLREEECHHVYRQLFEDMDWIGSTEHLLNETLPLLSYIANRTIAPHSENKSPTRMSWSRLDKSEQGKVIESTRWDTVWYEKMREQFQFRHWQDAILAK